MANNPKISVSESGENFGLEDCDALLKFPYHDYVPEVKIEEDDDLPALGSSGFLVLNADNDGSKNVKSEKPAVREDETNESALLRQCRKLNFDMQVELVKVLNMIQQAIQKNHDCQLEMQRKIQEDKKSKTETEGKIRSSRPVSLFAAPYFRDVRGMVPPDNEDTIAKMKNCDVTAYLQPPRPWIMQEKDKLMNGVGANALNYVLKKHKTKRDYLKNKLKEKGLLDFEIDILKKQIIRTEHKIKKEINRPFKELLKEAEGNIDWMTISATNLECLRTEEECEIMWNNYLSVFINKKPFTLEEDTRLKKLNESHRGRNWDLIAQLLQTNRSAIQCFERYQTRLNDGLTKKYWTPEEDRRLLNAVNKCRVGKYIPWNKVCCSMEGRTRYQLINRYERTLASDIRRTPWSKEEDAMLIACVQRFGCHWSKMKEFFLGRPTYSCRERYVNTLDPTLKIGDWSKEEDTRLIHRIREYGYGKWSKIAKGMPGRTDNMCLVRAERLKLHSILALKHSPHLLKENTNDPENIAKILQPIAPSHACHAQNDKLKNIRLTALQTLRSALEKIAPNLDEVLNLETLNLKSVNLNTLRELHKELCSNEESDDCEPWTPHYVRPENKRKSNKNINLLEDMGDDVEDIQFSPVEKLWLQKLLETKLSEEASLQLAKWNPKHVALNTREAAECTLYLNYLEKEYSCLKIQAEEDEVIDSFIFNGIDYNLSLADAVRLYIQPEVSEDQMMILSPNCTTLSGMDVIQMSRSRLQRTAQFVHHSVPYVRYVTDNSNEAPKCIKCSGNEFSKPEEMLDAVVKAMNSKLLVVDEKMKKAAECEIRYSENQQETCVCNKLAESKDQIDLFSKRFLSLFLWPFLLSSTPISEVQEENIDKSDPVKYTMFKEHIKKNGIKKVHQVKRRRRKSKPVYSRRKKPCIQKRISTESSDTESEASFHSSGSEIEPYVIPSKLPVSIKKNLEINLHKSTTNENSSKSAMSTPSTPLRRSSRRCVKERKLYSFIDQELSD